MKKNIIIYVNLDTSWITPFKDKGKKALELKEEAESMINLRGSKEFYDTDHLQSLVFILRDCADQALMYIEYLERGRK